MNNIKSQYIYVNVDNKWQKEKTNKVIENILDNRIYDLTFIIEELGNKIDNKIKILSEYYIKIYNDNNKLDTETLKYKDHENIIKRNKEIKSTINEIIEDIKIILYNKTKEIHNKINII